MHVAVGMSSSEEPESEHEYSDPPAQPVAADAELDGAVTPTINVHAAHYTSHGSARQQEDSEVEEGEVRRCEHMSALTPRLEEMHEDAIVASPQIDHPLAPSPPPAPPPSAPPPDKHLPPAPPPAPPTAPHPQQSQQPARQLALEQGRATMETEVAPRAEDAWTRPLATLPCLPCLPLTLGTRLRAILPAALRSTSFPSFEDLDLSEQQQTRLQRQLAQVEGRCARYVDDVFGLREGLDMDEASTDTTTVRARVGGLLGLLDSDLKDMFVRVAGLSRAPTVLRPLVASRDRLLGIVQDLTHPNCAALDGVRIDDHTGVAPSVEHIVHAVLLGIIVLNTHMRAFLRQQQHAFTI